MTPKRRALSALTKPTLLAMARHFELDVRANDAVDELREAIAESKKAKLAGYLPNLSRDELKAMCRELGLDDGGKEKLPIVDRIVAKLGGGAPAKPPVPPEPVLICRVLGALDLPAA